MAEEVQGIKSRLTSDKYRSLLGDRIQFHRGRVKFYDGEIQKLETAMEGFRKEAQASGKFSSSGQSDPVEAMKQRKTHHTDKETFFTFLYDNLIPNAMYTLSIDDLTTLEVLKSRY